MITYHPNDDLFASHCDVLVCPVNCVGVAGSGLALAFKRRFRAAYKAYNAHCHHWKVRSAEHMAPHVYYTGELFADVAPRAIVHLPTKRHWRGFADPLLIAHGLQWLAAWLADERFTSIAVPRLGCGLGHLAWEDVRPMIVRTFDRLPDLRVKVYGEAP